MRKFKVFGSLGFVGGNIEDVLEFEDDTTDEEIAEVCREYLLERYEFSWSEITDE